MRDDYFEHFIAPIRDKLAEESIENVVQWRFKHLYSVYGKMVRDHKEIDEIYDVSRDNGAEIEKDDIRRSFRQNGIIADNFWNAARLKFDPDIVLEESQWEIGFVKNRKAEIIITYIKSSRPSKLKMYKEGGSWRVGLVETFWPRRYMESLFSFLRL